MADRTIVINGYRGVPGPAGGPGPQGNPGPYIEERTNDPELPVEGYMWYRTDIKEYRASVNGNIRTFLLDDYQPDSVPRLTADPDPLVAGMIWFRIDESTLNIYDGTSIEKILTTAYNPDNGGGNEGPVPTSPSQLLNLGNDSGQNHFNLGIGLKNSSHINISPGSLAAGYSRPDYFELSTDKTEAILTCPVAGGTTSENTQYARVEFREFNEAGDDEYHFRADQGTHYIKGHSRLVHLAPTKPWVVLAQMHDGDDDNVKIMTRVVSGVLKLVLTVQTPVVATLVDPIAEGDEFDWEIRLVDGTLTIWIDGVLKHTDAVTFNNDTAVNKYFKAGNYTQSNESTESNPDEYFRIALSKLEHHHTGWAPAEGSMDPGSENPEESYAGAWTNITFVNNTTSRSGMPTAAVRKEGFGKRVFMRSGLDFADAFASNTVLGVIPEGFRPPYTVTFPGRSNGGTNVLTVNTVGEIRVAASMTLGGWLSFDNIHWTLD